MSGGSRFPRLGPFVALRESLLEANEGKSRRERMTCMRLYEALQPLGRLGAGRSAQAA